MKQAIKFGVMAFITAVLGWALNVGLQYITSQWTLATMEQARHNMGDQVSLRAAIQMWGLIWWGSLLVGVGAILGIWYLVYRKTVVKVFAGLALLVLLAGCQTRVVLITPPNYGIVVSLSNTENQATGNSFDSGQLLNVTQQEVGMVKCAPNSPDHCPDKIVVEVQGSPESRIYSKDSGSGTSATNQALCFEANGANGCLDFSVTAIVLREDAKCYANKMGVDPFKESDGSNSIFHFVATPLSTALDTRVIQIASTKFAKVVATTSPLELALKKFNLFDGVKEDIVGEVHKQTCITITDIGINNGIVWDSTEIQAQINEATIIANRILLAEQQNELLSINNAAFIERALAIEKEFGTAAAVEFMRIQKWDGSGIVTLPMGGSSTVPAVVPAPNTQVPATTP